ncbi:hypothetical protein CAPTEDRAFT_203327, partial [Capitella teleta]
RHHKVKMRFCNCEKRAATLLKHRLWPARPVSPNAAYHIDFLMWYAYTCVFHCELQTDSLYRLFHNESFEEFRVLQARLASLMQQSERLCPICPKKRELIVCMDGNFGLVRKENSGRSFDPPILAGSLFIDDEDVQQHIKRANDTNNTQYKAVSTSMSIIQILHKQSNFRTAANLKPEVAESIIRWALPIRLGYPSLLLKAVMATCPPDTKLLVSYDIACTLEKYLKNTGTPSAKGGILEAPNSRKRALRTSAKTTWQSYCHMPATATFCSASCANIVMIDGPNSEDAPSMTQEAVRLYHRRRRCEEERESCLSEMCILLNHVLDQHEWLAKSRQQNAPTPPAKGLNLLINEKIEQLEEYYLVIKGMFRPFINGIPEMKRLPKTSYKNLSEMQQNSDDTEECEVPQPEYPCPLIEEPNSEDEF